MRSKSINTMSTRRVRRPDGRTYREMRKRSGRLSSRGGVGWIVAVIAVAALIGGYLLFR